MTTLSREKFIISADDFGLSQKANDRILELARANKLSRVAIMPNGLISPEEIKTLLFSGIKLDIHLDLEPEEISPKGAKRKLKEGFLKRSLYFLFLYLTGTLGALEIEKSWEKQMEKFENLFRKRPDGANSHQHVHFFPPYFRTILGLCLKHNVAYLHFGHKSSWEYFNPVCFILNFLRFVNLKRFSREKIETSDIFLSLDWIKNIENFTQTAPREKIEIICHPERDEEFSIIKKYF